MKSRDGLSYIPKATVLVCSFWLLLVNETPLIAKVRFLSISADLGELKTGVPATHAFILVNNSDTVVRITSVRGSCGCVAPKLQERTIPPGKKGCIPVELNTLGQQPGPHRWYVFVRYFVGMEERESSLQVLANLVSEVNIKPSRLVFHLTGSLQQTIRLTDTRKKLLRITAVQSSDPKIRCHLMKPKHSENETAFPINLTVTDKFADGKHEAFVSVHTDDDLYKTMKIPIVIFKSSRQRIVTTPRQVVFRIAGNRPVASQLLYIRDTMEKPVRFKMARSNHPGVQVRWATGPGTLTTVRIQVKRDKLLPSDVETSVEFVLTEPEPHVLVVPVRFMFVED